MRYQNPQLLYALFAIAIPILIHLFNLRKHKKIYFSSIRFLTEIKEKRKKRAQLKNLLILTSRILAITFLVLAFSKPYIPKSDNIETNNIFIYIDNSLSMDVDYGEGNLLNLAKNISKDIIQAYSSDNQFHLITNNFNASDNISYSINTIQDQIDHIQASSRQKGISDIISRINLLNSERNHLYIISDFQKKTIDIDGLNKLKTDNKTTLVCIKNNELKNISIDSCFINSPIFMSDNETELKVIISNTSKKDILDEVLFLYIDNKQRSQQYINLSSNEKKEITLKFSNQNNQIISGEIRTHDSPISFDNNLYFTLYRNNKINVLTINEKNENTALGSLFGADTSLFNYTSFNTENINYNTLAKQNFIIFNEVSELSSGLLSAIEVYLENNGSLLIIPPAGLNNFSSYNLMLKSLDINLISKSIKNEIKINKFTLEHSIYKNVFKEELKQINYPICKEYYKINNNKLSTQIIGFSNQKDFLSLYNKGKGTIYQLSSPLDLNYNNFTKHALFVPTFINMATASIQIDAPYYIIDRDDKVNSNYKNIKKETPHIIGNEIDIIPTPINKNGKQVLEMHNQINKNGIYSLKYNNKIVDKFAFNYNNKESRTNAWSYKQLNNYISENRIANVSLLSSSNKQLSNTIKEYKNGKEYWKISLLLSLLFFALEILIIKIIKL
ncbi:MAG: hypothetical protein CMD16_01270 [Flavobacteriales bacterium]|nr:hypothetical protein [Flavobacteriales bacterium]|tara:strand:- start:42882 stop:44900 length:2019 start_codon:yes stop_codon:yes gene_type:complete